MPHPQIDNRTPFANSLLVVNDKDGVQRVVMLLQASYDLDPDGGLRVRDPQDPVPIEGRWTGDPSVSSVVLEPQTAWQKPSTDVVLTGRAVASGPGVREMAVGIRVGPIQKGVRVVGDRYLSGRGKISLPQPFESIPLCYERAFGGWDRRHPDPARHRFEARNPVGRGFRDAALAPSDDVLLPNLEDPDTPMRAYGDRPPPAAFGFIAGHWQPRVAFAGTYDKAWAESRSPLLPDDFDLRFFNAASPGLVSPKPLAGDEIVTLVNVGGRPRMDFALPGLGAPTSAVASRGGRRIDLAMSLDTLIVDADAWTVSLLWRSSIAARDGIHDVVAIEFRFPGMLHIRDARL